MSTGWTQVGSNWYFLNGIGEMRTGWVQVGSNWFYLTQTGAMVTGPQVVDRRVSRFSSGGGWLGYDSAGTGSASSIGVLVNKRNPLRPIGYVPLLSPMSSYGVGGGQSMRPEAAEAMGKMVSAARDSGINMQVGSGYRSYGTQAALFSQYSSAYGVTSAETFSARPGYSEHQTGLAADLNSIGEGGYLSSSFANTNAGRWVQANAWRYGFIVRYPNGYTNVTGFVWEPWHVRYVGIAASTDMYYRSVTTYEQYLGASAAPSY